MKTNYYSSGFDVPGMGKTALELYTTLYGEEGARHLEVLNSSPPEVAVISRLVAYLQEKMGGVANGSED